MDINFNLKFFEPGVRSSVTISGAYEIVKNIEEKTVQLFEEGSRIKYHNYNLKKFEQRTT
jgi:hypothetical protein